MRKLAALRNMPDGCDYTLSLVPWGGLMRRWAEGREAKTLFGFVPRYELGILPGIDAFNPDVLNPCCIFHFAGRATTEEMFHKIAQAIIQDGLHGKPMASIVRDADPTKVDARWAPSLQPMAGSEVLNNGEITESEAAEFKTRLEHYIKKVSPA